MEAQILFETKNTKSVCILCLKEDTEKILTLLIKCGKFQFNSVESDDGLIIHSVINTDINEKINSLSARINVDKEQNSISKEYYDLTLDELESKIDKDKPDKKESNAIVNALSLKYNINMIYSKLGEQGDVNIIKGWIPSDYEKKIAKDLLKITKNIVIYVENPKENAPVLLKNNGFFKPFELLTKLYSAPRYGDIDPTPIFAITFMLCFGIMTSDVIDGLIIVLVGLIGYLKTKNEFFKLGLILGISSVLFGFVFGEALGGIINIPVLWFNPFDNPVTLLKAALIFGIIHLNIAHLIGLINDWKREGILKGITNHFSFILMINGGVLMILNNLQTGGIMLSIGLILLILNKKISKIVELPSLIGNIISYSRILAINMAHIGINRAFSLLAISLNNIIIGIITVSFGHFIILTLGLVVAFVHTLRLHFVEFFTKFMEQGIWFEPFKLKKYKPSINK